MQFPIDRAWPLDTVSGLKVTLLPALTGMQVTKKKMTMKIHKSAPFSRTSVNRLFREVLIGCLRGWIPAVQSYVRRAILV